MRSSFIFFLSVLLFLLAGLTGCGPEGAFAVSKDYIRAKEKEWLQKAYRVDRHGWIYLHIEGKPFERGFQRGFLTAYEIDEFLKTAS